jgi:uncharacterized membrane protein YdjX (TVP38/TMEM64 family)
MVGNRRTWTLGTAGLVVVGVGLYLYYDRHMALSSFLQSLGIFGIAVAIILMAIVCTTPVPSEGLLIVYLKIYGAWWGSFYAWIGAVLSSLIVFVMSRSFGTTLVQSLITQRRFQMVDHWIQKRGTGGLLFMRLLPIPGYVVSYIVGTIPSVRLWSFVWTGAVAVLPYYAGVSLLYLGVSHRLVSSIGIGMGTLSLVWLCGYFVKRIGVDEK